MAHHYAMGLLMTGLLATASAQAAEHRETFMPENDLHLQDCRDCESGAGLTEAQFNATIDKGEKIFSSIIQGHGGRLSVARLWNDSTVNASALQIFNLWQVNMYGGLARRPEITVDGFTLVLCHEIGHHLGGFPFVSFWGADEGEADYFATHVCPALWWSDEASVNASSRDTVPLTAKNACDDIYKTEAAQNLCYRSMLASKSISDLLAALHNGTVSFDQHDNHVVGETDHAHPAAQCRLDTYAAATICTQPWDLNIIPGKRGFFPDNGRGGEQDSANFTCTASGQYQVGLRPRCWFKPTL
ncbi:MAG: hypothetical protein NTZ90_13530 [Proteobacteria bacterium]|nr:hypothetical protein [Pseudomonadota bacterium]